MLNSSSRARKPSLIDPSVPHSPPASPQGSIRHPQPRSFSASKGSISENNEVSPDSLASGRLKWASGKREKSNRSPSPSAKRADGTYANGYIPTHRQSLANWVPMNLPSRRKIFSRSRLSGILLAICVVLLVRGVIKQAAPGLLSSATKSPSALLAPVTERFSSQKVLSDGASPNKPLHKAKTTKNKAAPETKKKKPAIANKPAHQRNSKSTLKSLTESLSDPDDSDRHPIINGFMHVNTDLPVSSHPIYQLVEDANREWDAKVARQSKTLAEAVKEYKRRNAGRAPPKGFDHWWNYVQENQVTLPDEYDRIMIDLLPFHAFSPKALRERLDRMANGHDVFTIEVKDGVAGSPHQTFDSAMIFGSDDRRDGQVDLIKEVAKWIPDMEAVFSIHDTPSRWVSFSHLEELRDSVEDGEYFDPNSEVDMPPAEWASACPPLTPLRKLADPMEVVPQEGKSFIVNHLQSMDICQHPEIVPLHGTTAGVNPHAQHDLLPVFSLSKTHLHADILGIPVEQWGESTAEDELTWEQKFQTKLLWRGRNTGTYYSKTSPWRNSHRSRLPKMAGPVDEAQRVPVLPPPGGKARSLSLEEATLQMKQQKLNDRLMDIGLAYTPIQCNEEDGSCQDIIDELHFAPVLTFEEEKFFRYILDIDGNAWSARFKRLLTSGALVLKSTIYPEWWNDRIQPWKHYVPIQIDYSDIYDIMTFFRGDEFGQGGDDEVARKIAENGRQWSLNSWRKQDMTAYMFRLYLEWARLLAPSRSSMDFVLEEEE